MTPTPSAAPAEPSPAQIASACLSYRHDFGLMDKNDRERLMIQAKQWLHAWRKEFEVVPDAPKGEPTCKTCGDCGFVMIDYETGECCPDCHPASGAGTPHGAREPVALNDDSTAVDLWAEIWRLREAVKGPTGYATWQDAATDERIRRVKAEAALKAREPADLTDEKIDDALEAWFENGPVGIEHKTDRARMRAAFRAAGQVAREPSEDAKDAAREPMTLAQRIQAWDTEPYPRDFHAGVRAAEAFHGITAKATTGERA